ncbi:hypothetical protein [uncultured Methanobrevibacter sp.]|uniref:hypothetical protein n=1 Tax=uncultured Methanobrevibacter sp. TaxID=253161 RepID=UPI0025D49F7C|nr:hypothetical protein [uncultured Methanobrevibacter sp.]
MKRIFLEVDYDGDLSDLSVSHELEKLFEYTDFELRRFNSVDTKELFRVTIGNG